MASLWTLAEAPMLHHRAAGFEMDRRVGKDASSRRAHHPSFAVIPGRAPSREPGIQTAFVAGFRFARFTRVPE
jgi:hypothetical protein